MYDKDADIRKVQIGGVIFLILGIFMFFSSYTSGEIRCNRTQNVCEVQNKNIIGISFDTYKVNLNTISLAKYNYYETTEYRRHARTRVVGHDIAQFVTTNGTNRVFDDEFANRDDAQIFVDNFNSYKNATYKTLFNYQFSNIFGSERVLMGIVFVFVGFLMLFVRNVA
ncbi:MAG: hypothetical protein LKG27_05205 [Clostridiaceae bacterium]|jgi:hypothetical protein|nr:hypothetical protein [Clostridiaceae bacterium]